MFAIVMVSFSGCVAEQAKQDTPDGENTIPDAAPPAGFDENTGGIEGTVFDEESAPLPGVQVGAQAADAEPILTTSDVQGKFTFSNLAPGTYHVQAAALGYQAAAKAVPVEAGAISPAQFVLVQIAVVDAYYETLPFKGFFDCTWVIPLSSGPCGYIGQTNGTTGNPLEPLWINSKRKWNYPAGPNLMAVVHDLTWTQGSFATGEKMAMTFSHGPLPDGTLRAGTHFWCNGSGLNPVQMHWEREELDETGECVSGGNQQIGGTIPGPQVIDPNGMTLQSFVSTGAGRNPATGGDLPVGLAYQQPFDLYISLFYGEGPEDGFTALVDG